MIDQLARDLWGKKDVVELFRYLGKMWLKVSMEILEDLIVLRPYPFIPSPNDYQAELRSAGIFVERMELAMVAALHKAAQQITWEKFMEIHGDKAKKIPFSQRREVRDFWFAGAKPGLTAGPKPPAVIGAPGDWFVTGFSGNSLSLVAAVGFTSITGSITFSNANGDKSSPSLAMIGPSVGLSYTPNVGAMAAKLPGATQFMTRFPVLAKMITGNEEKFSERVLLFLWSSSPKIRAAITAFPAVKNLIEVLVSYRGSASVAAESFWSDAVGLVVGKGVNPLKPSDFSGQCVCYAVTGAVGPGNFGTYVLFFGIDRSWSILSEPSALIDLMRIDAKSKGVAVLAAASVAASFPSLGAGATLFCGEIV